MRRDVQKLLGTMLPQRRAQIDHSVGRLGAGDVIGSAADMFIDRPGCAYTPIEKIYAYGLARGKICENPSAFSFQTASHPSGHNPAVVFALRLQVAAEELIYNGISKNIDHAADLGSALACAHNFGASKFANDAELSAALSGLCNLERLGPQARARRAEKVWGQAACEFGDDALGADCFVRYRQAQYELYNNPDNSDPAFFLAKALVRACGLGVPEITPDALTSRLGELGKRFEGLQDCLADDVAKALKARKALDATELAANQ